MSSNAFARFPSVMRSLTALILLIAGQSVTPSFGAAAEPNSPGQWFISLITTYNQKSFCIPATTRLIDVTQAVAQYTQSHQTSGAVSGLGCRVQLAAGGTDDGVVWLLALES